MRIQAIVNPEYLYSAVYNEPGFTMTLAEQKRTGNSTLLDLRILDSDERQAPLAVIKAACSIGKELGKTHFIIADETKLIEFGEFSIKIFFTSDVSKSPETQFGKAIPEKRIKLLKESGYLSIEDYEFLFRPPE